MKFIAALFVATFVNSVLAAPAHHARQIGYGCPAPTEASCIELHNRCVTQGASVLANPWNNRECTAAATCYGVGNLLTSYSCRLGAVPPSPSSLPALSTSFFPNPTTQQNYIDFYYGTINAAWPSSVNVVTGYWAPIISWINTGSSAPYNNLNDWFHWSSAPAAPTWPLSVIPVTPPTPTPTPTPTPVPTSPAPTPTECVAPTDVTCADIVNGCLADPSWNSDPWSQKKCIAAAACFSPLPLMSYGMCLTGRWFTPPFTVRGISEGMWTDITGSATGAMTPQNFVDLIYSSIASAWPSSPEFVKDTWLAPIQSVTNKTPDLSYIVFDSWLRGWYDYPDVIGNPATMV